MLIRNRIKELRYVKAKNLKNHLAQWRMHPTRQHAALQGILSEIGWAGAAIAYESGGNLVLCDGHLRKKVAGNQKVPVLVLDVTEAEADKLLATLDPLAAMAEQDDKAFKSLAASITTDSGAVREMLARLGGESAPINANTQSQLGDLEFRIVVDCESEQHQAALLVRFETEGLECRALMS